MTSWDGDRPDDYHPRSGMFSGVSGYSQTSISGPALSGYLDMRPDTGISGFAWLGIAAGLVVIAVFLWSWLAGL